MGYSVRCPRPRRPCLRAEDLHVQLLWKMKTQSPTLLSTHAPPKQFLPEPQFPQLSEEEFPADTNGNDTTANMLETCDVLFDSPQPYEEGRSLPSFDR